MFLLNVVQNNEVLIKQLQDKVDKSSSLVKGMEQKVISIQEDQIDFLNNVITSLSWALGTVLAFIVGIAVFIGYLNRQAQKKMDDAEKAINQAKFYIDEFSKEKALLEKSRKELEEYRNETKKFRTETEARFTELAETVREIDQLKGDTQILFIKHQISIVLEEIRALMSFGNTRFKEYQEAGGDMKAKEIEEYKQLRFEYMRIEQEALAAIAGKLANGSSTNLMEMQEIYHRGEVFRDKCIPSHNKLDKFVAGYLASKTFYEEK